MNDVEQTAAALEAAARSAGFVLSGDLRIAESDAADLLGLSAGHLKALRQEGSGPDFYRVGIGGARVSYRLSSLAEWLESKRNLTADNGLDAES